MEDTQEILKNEKSPISASIDFENNRFIDGSHHITVAALYRCNVDYDNEIKLIFDGKFYGYHDDLLIEHLLLEISDIARFHNRWGINIYIHNLSYDYGFIITYLLDNEYNNVSRMWEVKQSTKNFFIYQLANGSVYFLMFFYAGVKICFRCSYAMSRLSIEQEGKLLGIEKKGDFETRLKIENEYKREYNYNIEPPEFFKKYCLRDCEIAHKFRIKNYGEKYNTLANRSVMDLELKYEELTGESFINDIINQDDPKYIWDFCYCAYRGGLNVINDYEIGKEHNNVEMYDINSFFPYCMTLPLPVKIIDKEEYEQLPAESRSCIYLIRVTKIIPKIPGFNFFAAVRKNGNIKDYITTSEFDDIHIAYYFNFEWEELQNYMSFEYDIIDTIYFETKNFLKSTIEYFYNYRIYYDELLQKEPHNLEYEIQKTNIKNMLNSCYGKFAQKYTDITKVYYKKEMTLEELDILKDTLGSGYIWEGEYDKDMNLIKPKCYKVFDKYYVYHKQRVEYRASDYSPIHIAGCITAHSRKIMMETIRKVGPDNVINGATDSLKVKAGIFPAELIHRNKLGFWKNETNKIDPDYYAALSKKFYIWVTKSGDFGYICSGISKNKKSWCVRSNENEEWTTLKGIPLFNYIIRHRKFEIKNAKLMKQKTATGNILKEINIIKQW